MPYFGPAIIYEKGRKLKAGEKLTYTYRILVESERSDAKAIEKAYQEYIKENAGTPKPDAEDPN